LPIVMTLSRALTVLILTIIMCCVSGVIAVKKLSAADPADIF
jgi:putative ABC transport system permease protein